MNKALLLALVAAGFVYLAWQTIDLRTQLTSMKTINQQQAKGQQTLQQSINDLTAVMERNAQQPKMSTAVIDSEDVADSGESGERLTDIEEVLLHLQEQIDNMAQTQSQENQMMASTDSEGKSQASANQVAQPELTLEQRAQQQQARIDLIEHMVSDPAQYDAVWSPQTQQKIDKMIAEKPELSVASSSSSQCGSSICKVTATLPNDVTALDKDIFNWTLIMGMGQDLPSSTYTTKSLPDGTQELTFYFAREGHSFPQPPDRE